MLKPLTMNHPVHFGAKTTEGGSPNNKSNFDEIQNNAKDLREKSTSEKVKSALLIGTAIGTLIGGCGTNFYKNSEINNMLNEMAAEVTYGEIDSLGVKDITKDGNPDIILYGKDGASTVYDMKNNNILIDTGDELVEQIR